MSQQSVRPRLLDLFCGAGGAAMGYYRAGFDVVGVDLRPQPRYPFAFVQGDALNPPVDLSAFDAIHASPPCQAYTNMSERWRGRGTLADERPELIAPVRDLLESTGLPYVIENVAGAWTDLRNPLRLTGEMFGLGVHRPRLFECCPFILAPAPVGKQKRPVAVYGKNDGRRLWSRADGSELRAPKGEAGLLEAGEAMGVDWMEWDELKESIPPAYCQWIGEQLMQSVRAAHHTND